MSFKVTTIQFFVISLLFTGFTHNLTGQELKYQWEKGEERFYRLKLETEFDDRKLDFQYDIDHHYLGEASIVRDELGNYLPAEQVGTGLVLKGGFFVTASGLLMGAEKFTVEFQGKKTGGKILRTDQNSRLTLIKLDKDLQKETFPVTKMPGLLMGDHLNLVPANGCGEVLENLNLNSRFKSSNQERWGIDSPETYRYLGAIAIEKNGRGIGMITHQVQKKRKSNLVSVTSIENLIPNSNQCFSPFSDDKCFDSKEKRKDMSSQFLGKIIVMRKKLGDNLNAIRFQTSGQLSVPVNRFKNVSGLKKDEAVLVIDTEGNRKKGKLTVPLPFILGWVGMLPNPIIKNTVNRSWSLRRKIRIAEVDEDIRAQYFVSPRGPFERKKRKTTFVPAEETDRFRIEDFSNGQAKIVRDYQLKSSDNENRPAYLLTGTETILFDTKNGKLVSRKFQGNFQQNSKSFSVRFPISYTLELRSPEEVLKEREEKRDRLAKQFYKSRKEREEAHLAKFLPVSDEEAKKLIELLKTQKMGDALRAFRLMKDKKPSEPNQMLSKYLSKNLAEDHIHRRINDHVLEYWIDSKKEMKALVKFLPKTRSTTQYKIIELIARHKQKGYLKFLVKNVEDSKLGSDCRLILESTGPESTDPILDWMEKKKNTNHILKFLFLLEKTGDKTTAEKLMKSKWYKDRRTKGVAERVVKNLKNKQ